MGNRADWIQERVVDGVLEVSIVQRRHAPIKMVGALLLGAGACALLLHLAGDTHLDGMMVLMMLLIGVVVVVAGGLFVMLAVPMWLLGKSASSFTVDREQLCLVQKLKRSYPDALSVGDISQCYVRAPSTPGLRRPSAPPPATRVTIIGGGVFGHSHNAAQAAGQSANAVGRAIGEMTGALMWVLNRQRYGVALNARGAEVLLADLLTQQEAEHLRHRVEALVRR